MIRRCSIGRRPRRSSPTVAVRTTLLAPVLAVLATACGAGDRSDASVWAGTRDTIGGVEVVRNPAEPLYGADAVEVERLWTAPTAEEQERLGLWERPFRLDVAGGRVYVLDNLAHRVYVLDAETGEWLRAFGRRGGGPGEFERPYDIVARDDRIAVGSGGGASIEVFDTAGEYLRTIRFDGIGFGLGRGAGDHYTVIGMAGEGAGGYYDVTPDGTGDLLDLPEPVTDPAYGLDDCTGNAVSAAGIVRVSCYEPVVYVIGLDGELTRELHIDRPPVEPDEGMIQQRIDSVRDLMAESGMAAGLINRMVERERERFRYLPLYGNPRRDPATGRVVVLERMPRGTDTGPPTAHLLSEDGEFLASIGFDRVWTDYRVEASTFYVLERDPTTDLTQLTAYQYRLPGAAAAEAEG